MFVCVAILIRCRDSFDIALGIFSSSRSLLPALEHPQWLDFVGTVGYICPITTMCCTLGEE